MGAGLWFYLDTKCAHELSTHFFAAQPGIGIGASDGQLGCSFHNSLAVLGGNESDLSTVRPTAHQQYFQLLDIVDQELPEASGQHVLCFLITLVANAGHQDQALESPLLLVVNTSEFSPIALNFDIWV